MIEWNYTLENQGKIYNLVYQKLKNFDFFQNLNFYVLPFMPQKFRARVIYFPANRNDKKLFTKNIKRVDKLKTEWTKSEDIFLKKLKFYFPKIDSISIHIEPSIYGTIGSYDTKYNNFIYIYPRYDRDLIGIQKLLINALTHYFMFDPKDDMNNPSKIWLEKQMVSKKIQEEMFPTHKQKSMTEILDRQFSGKLAEKSIKYLQELELIKLIEVKKPSNLTKSESITFDLLIKNKAKIVSFDDIADNLWKDNLEEKYSEYAITKLIERLKKKLPKNVIHVQRGVGYILISS